MNLYIMHAGISHSSPFFNNLIKTLQEYDDLNVICQPDIPNCYTNTKESIIYFHRLKRYYDSSDIKSIKDFIKKVDILKESGYKVVWTLHNFFPIDREISDNDYIFLKEFMKRVDKIFTISEYMKESLKNNFKFSAVVHGMGVNKLDGKMNSNNFNGYNKNKFTYTFIGNITPYRMLPDIIKAFGKLNLYDCRLIIAGPKSHNYNVDLWNIINNSKFKENIIYIDSFIGENDWIKLNEITNVYINLYDLKYGAFKYGFFPSSFIQLSQYKKFIIAPKSNIIAEIANKNSILEYDFNDENGLYNIMKYAYENKDELLQKEKRIEVKEYNWKDTADIIYKELKSIM